MLLGKIAKMINVIIVDVSTREANRIVLLLVRLAINVVERTTSKLCVDPVRDQIVSQKEKGQIGPSASTDVMCMKLMKIVMMTMALRI